MKGRTIFLSRKAELLFEPLFNIMGMQKGKLILEAFQKCGNLIYNNIASKNCKWHFLQKKKNPIGGLSSDTS
jgi:hypothetical protein